MNRSIFKCILSCIFVGISSGCLKKPHYTPQYLKPLNTQSAEYQKTIDGISLLAKKLNYEESAYLFGNRINCFYPDKKNLFKGIYPVQIAIQNTSSYAWIIDASAISLPLVTKRELIHILQQNKPATDHEAIHFDITRKIMPDTSTLNPDETLDALIFIRDTDWDPYFTVSLEQSDSSEKLMFHVHIKDTL